MTKFNDEYYIALSRNDDRQIRMSINERSKNYLYDGFKLSIGSPLFVEQGYVERDKRLGVTSHRTDIMSGCGSFIMEKTVKDKIAQYVFNGMQLYPSVFIDVNEQWYDNYWYLNIWEDLDCWDRKKSIYDPIDDDWDEDDTMIDQYYLDEQVLNEIPEKQRLIFRMGGESSGYIFMHQKLVDIFQENHFTGIRFFKVSEFTEGDQYQ
ncbi:imm11 family protein [Flocculibacter collagenilyticus]|uniref:imm11 family protein n=1 Tax=Flocculibacter collagenilyticus TaxID=2744479 RepID=UPI0018F61466|nr:DUF1629 domain-containing protein [Flocculibacter collagenilyticus]